MTVSLSVELVSVVFVSMTVSFSVELVSVVFVSLIVSFSVEFVSVVSLIFSFSVEFLSVALLSSLVVLDASVFVELESVSFSWVWLEEVVELFVSSPIFWAFADKSKAINKNTK